MFEEIDPTFLCDLTHNDVDVDSESTSFINTFIKECIDEPSNQLPIIPNKTLSKPMKSKRKEKHKTRIKIEKIIRKYNNNTNNNKNKYMINNDNVPRNTKNLSNYDKDNILPDNYRRSKGMGRKKQLQNMTQEQIKLDKYAKLIQNRISARECRARKKEYIQTIEVEIQKYEKKFKKQDKKIKDLRGQINNLTKLLNN
jgi:hypothetical protein